MALLQPVAQMLTHFVQKIALRISMDRKEQICHSKPPSPMLFN